LPDLEGAVGDADLDDGQAAVALAWAGLDPANLVVVAARVARYHVRMKAVLVAAVLAAADVGCGGPALQGLPHPNNGAMAAGFAAVAGAATLASPASAQKSAEAQSKQGAVDGKKPVNVKETVPSDVLDRLDHPAPDDGTPKAQPLPPAQDPKLDTSDDDARSPGQ
jgi:hypothetical protein